MRRLTPLLFISLLCGASTFAVEDVATKNRQAGDSADAHKKFAANSEAVPQNAFFDQLIGTWDVRYEFTDKDGKPRSNRGQCTMAGSSTARLCRRSGRRTRKVRTYGPSVRPLTSTTASGSAERSRGYIRSKA